MITNLMFEEEYDYDKLSPAELDAIEVNVKAEFIKLIDLFKASTKSLVLVSNEVGLGLVPPYRLGNYFRDVAGRINQYLASVSDEVYFVVSGIPMKIK